MAAEGVAALLVLGHSGRWNQQNANLQYVTNVADQISPLAAALLPANGPATLFLGMALKPSVEEASWVRDIRPFGLSGLVQAVADRVGSADGAPVPVGLVGPDGDGSVPMGIWQGLLEARPAVRPVDAGRAFQRVREIKEPEELVRLRKAGRMLDGARDALAGAVRPGMREVDAVDALCAGLDARGSQRPHFVLSASGPLETQAAPRLDAAASRRVLADGDVLWLEFNARVEGYSAHAMATVRVGGAPFPAGPERLAGRIRREVGGLLRGGTHPSALAALRDAHAARGVRFAKPLLHSIGMATPDIPALDPRLGIAQPLEEGMTVAVEIEAAPPGGPWICVGGGYRVGRDGGQALHRIRWTAIAAGRQRGAAS